MGNEHFGECWFLKEHPENKFGDQERCSLRPGNVHSADGWDGVLKPVVARYRNEFLEVEGIK
ncbi:MAG TPA: hypothetical protein VIF02_13885 [Methylocella sp.]|jgi:hypothetical protein